MHEYRHTCIHVSTETHFTQRCYDLYILFSENPHSGFVWIPYIAVLTLISQ